MGTFKGLMDSMVACTRRMCTSTHVEHVYGAHKGLCAREVMARGRQPIGSSPVLLSTYHAAALIAQACRRSARPPTTSKAAEEVTASSSPSMPGAKAPIITPEAHGGPELPRAFKT